MRVEPTTELSRRGLGSIGTWREIDRNIEASNVSGVNQRLRIRSSLLVSLDEWSDRRDALDVGRECVVGVSTVISTSPR